MTSQVATSFATKQLSVSSIPSSAFSSDAGVCPVCQAVFKVVGSSGVVRKHGHGHGRSPCSGSGKPPLAPSFIIIDTSANHNNGLLLTPDSTASQFGISNPFRPTLRRIPGGARQKCAQAFETRLRALLASPTDLGYWRGVLQFADCLSQPSRGGKRHNLTTQIATQIDRVTQPSQSQLLSHRRSQLEAEVRVRVIKGLRASAKLQEGDIRGGGTLPLLRRDTCTTNSRDSTSTPC